MAERDPVVGVRFTFSRSESRALINHWSSEEAFAEHVAKVAEESRGKCAKGAGECCMNVTLKSFSGEGEGERAKATVSAVCTAEDCPDTKLPFDPPFEAGVNAQPQKATPITLSEASSSQ